MKKFSKQVFVFLAGILMGLYLGEVYIGSSYQVGWTVGYSEASQLFKETLEAYRTADVMKSARNGAAPAE
ncbi:hypothetical protein [Rubinisphaera margarita]|uniref:hypothetical protein n=1 Tax=Rubinisphaera margarita TaxID=2909586 RepID=UPI001EE80C14|nr:hypothetical protein [Rubinisphaera margarita]MCG6157222.1 hypothetical protein [Rubinisphaera margarita]